MASTDIIVPDRDLITVDMADTDPVTFGPLLSEAFLELRRPLVGYDQPLLQALFALASFENVLWVSGPGEAKSMGAELIFELFPNAHLLKLLLTKDMQQQALFGQIIPKRLIETGEEITNLKGGIADVEFAFLDEVLDASGWTLRSLLNVINERVFRSKSMGEIETPLHSVIATTNFFRTSGELEAVVDRFLARSFIPGPQNSADWYRIGQVYLGSGGKRFDVPQLNYANLLLFAQWVESPDGVTISPGLQLLHGMLMREFAHRRHQKAVEKWANQQGLDMSDPDNADREPTARELGLHITPRTWAKALDFIRVATGLSGRNHLELNDLRAAGLAYCVLNDGSGSSELWDEVCDQLLGRLGKRQLELLDSIANLTDFVGKLGSEQGRSTEGELVIGGKTIVASRQTIVDFRQWLRGGDHQAVRLAMDELDQSVAALDRPTQPIGLYVPGWTRHAAN